MSIKTLLAKRGSTHFLRLALSMIGLGVVALCIFALPAMWRGASAEFPAASQAVFLIVLGLYATAIPFFIALWQAFKLLRFIDQGAAFSESSVKALRVMKRCIMVIAALYVGGVPLLYPIADVDDAPGLILIGMVIACVPITVAVFATVLEKLLQSAIEIQSENDLTV